MVDALIGNPQAVQKVIAFDLFFQAARIGFRAAMHQGKHSIASVFSFSPIIVDFRKGNKGVIPLLPAFYLLYYINNVFAEIFRHCRKL